MTNEEAKKNLLAYAYYVDEPMPPDVAKAFDMAIKALEQPEPCEDAVSRQAAIDKIKKRLFETAFNNVGIKQDVDKTLADVAENRLENWFNELQPAQTDIIYCKDCKWYGRADKRRFYRGMDCLQKRIATIVPDRDFCSKAERRTKNADVNT